MKDALKAIINQLTGIAYSDLSTAEQNILRIAVRGLGMTLYVNDDVITVK